ncbi:MAG: response regulator [Proteobacteria bacterium]|nr:response regulator [Pseudomonadota bacterium]
MDERRTILIVDDVSQIRKILRYNLEEEGYDVIDADSGEKAIEYASENMPDLIILDIMMPKMDGYEVLRRLRESDITKHIPVIFLTAKAQRKDVLKVIEAGGNDYVVKPYNFEELHRKIEKLIGYRALAAIMITDIVGFSEDMEKDEERTYSKLLTHNEIIRRKISKNRGREIKTIGDSFLVRFKSAVDAVKAAINIQNELLEYNKDKEKFNQILVRIGIHIGDILIMDNDVFGSGVNIASKIEPLAEPGGICISADVYNFAKKALDIKVSSLGKEKLKNIEDPPEVFKISITPKS